MLKSKKLQVRLIWKVKQFRVSWGYVDLYFIYSLITDAYELGISNVWNGTQLFINADLPDIIQFKSGFLFFHHIYFTACFFYLFIRCNLTHLSYANSLNVDEGSASQSQHLSSQSQMLTQSTSLTQHSSGDRFLNNALILPLSEVLKLTEVFPFFLTKAI
jgi:hypothetical protein